MGFWEFVVVAIVGLIVLGPERLPTAIRSVAHWIKTMKSFASSVSDEINNELKINELHDNLKKAENQGFKNLSPEVDASLKELRKARDAVNRPYSTLQKTVNSPSSDEKTPNKTDSKDTPDI